MKLEIILIVYIITCIVAWFLHIRPHSATTIVIEGYTVTAHTPQDAVMIKETSLQLSLILHRHTIDSLYDLLAYGEYWHDIQQDKAYVEVIITKLCRGYRPTSDISAIIYNSLMCVEREEYNKAIHLIYTIILIGISDSSAPPMHDENHQTKTHEFTNVIRDKLLKHKCPEDAVDRYCQILNTNVA